MDDVDEKEIEKHGIKKSLSLSVSESKSNRSGGGKTLKLRSQSMVVKVVHKINESKTSSSKKAKIKQERRPLRRATTVSRSRIIAKISEGKSSRNK